jgi:hypothetical protein
VKYPSVFFAILCTWIAILIIALALNDHTLTYQLYVAGVAFTIGMFVIGFWRNR